MAFEKFRQKHDPEGRADWTFEFRLNAGEEIESAVVDVVDSTSTTVDDDTDLVIETTSFGQISGTRWGVTVWISGGTPGNYFLRCRIETDATPLTRKGDKTMQLVCAEL
jgi:hypothetical protein